MTWTDVIENPENPLGHAFVLAMMLLGEICIDEED
jgi:hypothetical protein